MFQALGQKLKQAGALGGRFLENAGAMGRKFVDTSQQVLRGLERVPVVGEAMRAIPGYNTVNSALRFGGKLADAATLAGSTLQGKTNLMTAGRKAQSLKSDFERG
jgi:hypothetical protein